MLSSDKSDVLNDQYGNDESGSGSAVTCPFPFLFEEPVGCVDNSIGRVCGVGSGIFVLTRIESIREVVLLV